MKNYRMNIRFPESQVAATKSFKSHKEARFWGQLCLDICGRDERGRLYVFAFLEEVKPEVVERIKVWE